MIGMPDDMEMPFGPMEPGPEMPGQMPLNDAAFSGGELTELLKALLVEQAQARAEASKKFQSQAVDLNSQQFGVPSY